MINIKRIVFKNKNFKLAYYFKALLREIPLSFWYRSRLKSKFQAIPKFDSKALEDRVNYYNKLQQNTSLTSAAVAIAEFKIPEKIRVYYFDTKEYARYFDPLLKLQMIPGDVVDIPECPAIVKSRPIAGDNKNAVLLNLDKIRHFNFIQDDIAFGSKKDMLIGRFAAYQQHRKRFFELYFGNPLCDLGSVVMDNDHPEWYSKPISIQQHLDYKFILSLEGNDVATNLKWIMSSNSVAVMPLPKYETWFMEGRLIPDFHYIQIKDDYSDLEEKLHYYINHPQEAEKIIGNAHQYIQQFKNRKLEDLIALRVLEKYFEKTNQGL
ncbi:glycosyl transferase family 90 [Sphingobacterium spiritivorum]|uniref:glycosyl transferase family 90 n=1 Tax=Sphingobacterium spiritivorum TaxID=258 RepID=UPI001918375C|nr:glycosyl transferase family 90 [Sphingobacterium spiritivorum]QQT24222.1 lipopolysaccharide biosynthesis protein [Sphingobacterium spiritivorum]